jgi:hypothetical protein
MYSGYATGGQLGLPLAGSLAGAAAASLVISEKATGEAAIGVSLILLFGLLGMGRFFAELTTLHTVLLATAPLWFLLPRAAGVRWKQAWVRSAIGVLLVLVPLTIAVAGSRRQHIGRSAVEPTEAGQPTLDDYLNFGK